MQHVHAACPDATVIFDVGANLGGWTIAANKLWPQAEIHAFEPSPGVLAHLRAATAHLPVKCVACGLSDETRSSVLYRVPGHPALSSVHQRDLGAHGLSMSLSEEILLRTIDDYCGENGVEYIDFLKIDAEGHDLSVLRGAKAMLAAGSIQTIQFEFGGANIDSRTYLRDFVALLTPRYRISRIVAGGLESLQYSEREEIFVTANFLAERN